MFGQTLIDGPHKKSYIEPLLNLYCSRQKVLTEAVFAAALVERSRLIVALTEAVALPALVNQLKK
jgi:hypothetical protein